MPQLSFFYGISIAMFWNEGVHALPHFHARYSGHKASIDFAGNVLAGSLPPRALRLVKQWVQLHGDDLAANWELARSDQPLLPIAPLA